MNKNGRFRTKKISFTQVSNVALRKEGKLSLKAKGLYGLIQSFITIPDFTLYKNHLLSECEEGKKAFESAWKELKNKGFLIQYRLQDSQGLFYYEYELLDEPIELEEDSESSKSKSCSQSIHRPQKECMDKGGSGKGGIYNNTNSNNTDLNNTYSNNNNRGKKKLKGFKSIIENYTSDEELQNTIVEFIKMRKANKSMLTDDSLEKLLKKLNTLADNDVDKIEILNNSILKSYRDIFPLPEVKVTNKSKSNNVNQSNKSNELKFNNFDQRTYDYDKLEKELLGWNEE